MRLIDADSVKFTNFEIFMCEGDFKQAFKLLCEKLDDAPTVDAEPVRHGHWIEHTSWYWTQECECSECGNVEYGFNYPYETEKAVDHAGLYCKRCGAKMDEE